VERAWRYGRAHLKRYDPEGAAVGYMLKEMGGRVLDYGVRLPPTQDQPRGGYPEEVGGGEANPRRSDDRPTPATERDAVRSTHLGGQR